MQFYRYRVFRYGYDVQVELRRHYIKLDHRSDPNPIPDMS